MGFLQHPSLSPSLDLSLIRYFNTCLSAFVGFNVVVWETKFLEMAENLFTPEKEKRKDGEYVDNLVVLL